MAGHTIFFFESSALPLPLYAQLPFQSYAVTNILPNINQFNFHMWGKKNSQHLIICERF